MTFMHMDSTSAAAAVAQFEVLVSGAFVAASGFKNAEARYQWYASGLHYKDSTSSGWNIIPDNWITPVEEASGDFFIRIHSFLELDFGLSGVVVGDMNESFNGGPVFWYSLDAFRSIGYRVFDPDGESSSDFEFVAEIRYLDGSNTFVNNVTSLLDGAAIIARGNYSMFVTAF